MDSSNQYIALIPKFLSGDATDDEKQLLNDWIKDNELNKKQFSEFKKAWEISADKFDSEIEAIDLNFEWKKIEGVINFEDSTKTIDFDKRKKKRSFSWMQIAATITIFILAGSSLIYLFSLDKIELVAKKRIIEKELPDGSTITLKQNSTLVYNEDFNQETRKVTLEGEAFFEVDANKSKPFFVKAGKLNIKVVGTSFYVKNLKKANSIDVIVNSGRVLVYLQDNQSDSIILNAGEKVKFNKKKRKLIKKENTDENYLSWKTKILEFDNTSFQEIVNKLNHTYNSKIVIKNKNLNNCNLTVSFNNQSLESILKVLEATLEIKIIKKKNKILISGNGCNNEE